MYSKCFRQLDLDGNLIGELGGFEIMRALMKREQRNVSNTFCTRIVLDPLPQLPLLKKDVMFLGLPVNIRDKSKYYERILTTFLEWLYVGQGGCD